MPRSSITSIATWRRTSRRRGPERHWSRRRGGRFDAPGPVRVAAAAVPPDDYGVCRHEGPARRRSRLREQTRADSAAARDGRARRRRGIRARARPGRPAARCRRATFTGDPDRGSSRIWASRIAFAAPPAPSARGSRSYLPLFCAGVGCRRCRLRPRRAARLVPRARDHGARHRHQPGDGRSVPRAGPRGGAGRRAGFLERQPATAVSAGSSPSRSSSTSSRPTCARSCSGYQSCVPARRSFSRRSIRPAGWRSSKPTSAT